jgi:hypothetical protein
MTDRPQPLPVLPEGIPEVLKTAPRWVCWRLQPREDKWTKTPMRGTSPSVEASSTDPATWCAFNQALASYEDGKSDGIGFVLGDGWVGFDADGTDAPEHVQLLNTYAETSVGGKGVHCIARGTKPGGKCRVGPYELYSQGRYFTVTGHHLSGTPTTVEERTAEIAALYARLFPNGHDAPASTPPPSTPQDDDAVIALAQAAKNSAKFMRLWDGDTTGYRSHSEADAALCMMLAFWSNRDAAQMDRLFRRSGLIRAKWDERRGDATYGADVISSAIARTPRGYGDESTGIIMRGGDLTVIVDRAETALLADSGIYQRGGLLTRAIKLDTSVGNHQDVRREAGSTMLIAVREPWLVEQLGKQLRWFKVTAKGEPAPADPQPIYARTLLGRGEWQFPVLRGVITTPTLARDGRIIETPGFDPTSGLLVDITAGTFPRVPEAPTKDAAVAALDRLCRPLRGFPFVDDAARSVALGAMLTALVRLSLRTAPLHAFDAPTAGTGKSMLAEGVGLLATGFRPPALSQGKSSEEDEKRLSTVLFAGDPVIHIDNCERDISGDFLCSMLTQEVVQARILGLSERRVLPATALVLASGNNLVLAGDASRRAVICRLDAKVERPDTRTFDFDFHAELLAARPELVVSVLTVLRAYHAAGRPEKLTPMGSFTDWEWIRGALVWLGHADPADTRESILDSDPRKDELLVVLDLWQQAFGVDPTEVAEVDRRTGESVTALRNKLIEVACRKEWSGKSVGWWLRRHKDRVVDGRCLQCEQYGGRQRWWVTGNTEGGGVQVDVPF